MKESCEMLSQEPSSAGKPWPLPVSQLPSFTQHVFFEKRTRYACVIPVLNEGERIRTQLERSREILQRVDTVIVDGGSNDGSTDLGRMRESGIRGLLIKTGPGRLSAQLRIGIAFAMAEGYEGVVLIDGNNKDEPEEIERFIQRLDAGDDHIQGSRFIAGGRAVNNPWSRILAIRLLHAPLLSAASRVRYTDTTNGFRAYSRSFLLDERVQPFRSVFTDYELHYYLARAAGRLGFRVREVGVTRSYPAGKIPTKIQGMRGNLKILRTLWAVVRGYYDPR
ncbi:MAG: glycosyltransferase family 2 protein [Bdellovibrionales bacterium]|nr:glycosyltransferase family 2 protein [Bdellovibrionales bacterium]